MIAFRAKQNDAEYALADWRAASRPGDFTLLPQTAVARATNVIAWSTPAQEIDLIAIREAAREAADDLSASRRAKRSKVRVSYATVRQGLGLK